LAVSIWWQSDLVRSAGIATHGVNPKAIKVMGEVNVDISHHTSYYIEEYLEEQFDVIFTVCDHARENCPVFPSTAEKFIINLLTPQRLLVQMMRFLMNSD